jgi:molybdate/tungstate transport system substrate-binding protein
MNSWTQMQRLVLALTSAILLCLSMMGCRPSTQEKVELKVICAGSLMAPFIEVEKAYETQNPHVDVLIEGHGSVQVIRQVTELDARADVIAVADHSLIPAMMYPVLMPESDHSFANWYIKFATNTLGLAYTSGSKYAAEINAGNWHEILARPDVKLGLPDPRFDACGYRAMMACHLAGLLYDDSDLFHKVLGDFEYPILLQVEDDLPTILVPEILRPKKVSLRGSSVVLLGILESGDIDYAFEYKSVALQRNLHFLEFPPEINLSSDIFDSQECDLRVKIDYQRFASLIPDFVCQKILYGVTIPENSPHPEQALDFLKFLLGPEGQKIFAQQHQPFLKFEVDRSENLPDELRNLLDAGQ